MLRPFLLFLLLVASFASFAQVSVSGRVVDDRTLEPLAFVNIVPPAERDGATTDIDGRFAFTVPALPVALHLSYVGYAPLALMVHEENLLITPDGPELLTRRAPPELPVIK